MLSAASHPHRQNARDGWRVTPSLYCLCLGDFAVVRLWGADWQCAGDDCQRNNSGAGHSDDRAEAALPAGMIA